MQEPTAQPILGYDAPQLSVPPSRIRLPHAMIYRQTFGHMEPEVAAALLIYTIQQAALGSNEDKWVGVDSQMLDNAASRFAESNSLLTRHNWLHGTTALCEAGYITIERGPDYDVARVDESMISLLKSHGYVSE